MKTIIVTCFQPFGDYPANSSELAARAINGCMVSGYHIDIHILPASISIHDRAGEVFEKASRLRASGIICLGMASEKTGLCVELQTRNRIENAKYCPPELNHTPIDPNIPYDRAFELDHRAWNLGAFQSACLKEGIGMGVSNDPGGFCCNHLMYQMYWSAKNNPAHAEIPWIYLHVPCSPTCIPKPQKAFYDAGKETMEVSEIAWGLELLLTNAKLKENA